MEIDRQDIGRISVLTLKGKMMIGRGDIAYREAVHEVLDSGRLSIVVNLQGVSLIDSSGIGELVSSFTTVNNRRGRLVLSGLSGKVRDLLEITQLIRVFQVFDTDEEAIASFD